MGGSGADVVVIGAGLSGLTAACLLAEAGRSVIVLEQHLIPGGYLQQFQRRKTVFDVGFHYMGSTAPGRPMRQLLEHLRVWDRLRLIDFPADAAIEVRGGGRSWAYPARWDDFREKARATWPAEAAALEAFARETDELCGRFKWFALRRGRDYVHPLDMDLPTDSLARFLRGRFRDPWLEEVLRFQSFNLGLNAEEIPWYKHLLAFRSNFDVTCRIDGGGGALIAALVERGRELGVRHVFRSEVASFECEGRSVRAALSRSGERFEAGLFLAACHPKPIVRALPDEALKPMFKERILSMAESRGAFQVFLRLKGPLRSLGSTCVMIRDEEEERGEIPLGALLVTYPSAVERAARGEPRLEAMTYLHDAPFRRWAHLPVLKRGEEYEALKARLAERVIGMIARIAPELPGLIKDVYSATPLSDAWYTRNERGGVFGISHEVGQQGTNRPMPRTRVRNLFFSGHSIAMPGICGTTINAFDTCEMLLGSESLFEQCAV